MDKNVRILRELLELYDEIEIPIVQRDYAQGRSDDHSLSVRTLFLKDIKNAIENEILLDINFVYGKKIIAYSNTKQVAKFIPIDGQQRLTTLLLLHIYAFSIDDEKTALFGKFSYKTRITSREFLKKLIQHRRDIFVAGKPSFNIKDAEWFHVNWINDPTIRGMLVMLDEIAATFSDVDKLGEKLWQTDNPSIVFHFVDIEKLGQEDALYIKLNERGKPLTQFENFKSKLIWELKRFECDFEQKFECNFDTTWTDLFWSKEKGVNFDILFLRFFKYYLMNSKLIYNDTNSTWVESAEYNLNEFQFKELYIVLNQLSKNIFCGEKLFETLQNQTYVNMLKFHCIVKYLNENHQKFSREIFDAWIRVMYNLINNSQIDTYDKYTAALNSINEVSLHSSQILEFLNNNTVIKGFSIEQLEEERIKANLILENNDFADKIYQAESHPYFDGQIRGALYLSKNDSCYDISMFTSYWNKISLLFDKGKSKYGNKFRQAILTFGDYTMSVNGYSTLCVDDSNESSRTPSFKSLFSGTNEYLTSLLNMLDESKDIEFQLDKIIENSTVPSNNWRCCFINHIELFDLMSKSHLRIKEIYGGNIILIRNKASSGRNYDVFLESLKIELRNIGIYTSESIAAHGAQGYRALVNVKGKYTIEFYGETFIIKENNIQIYKSISSNPIAEIVDQIKNNISKC